MALGERAKLRLRLLAGLLRARGHRLDMARARFYDEIQAIASSLPADQQAELKSLVDWLEDYERAEQAQSDTQTSETRRRAPRAKPKTSKADLESKRAGHAPRLARVNCVNKRRDERAEAGLARGAVLCYVAAPQVLFACRRDERTPIQAPQYGRVDRPARSERPVDCLVCIPRREPESGVSSDRPASYG